MEKNNAQNDNNNNKLHKTYHININKPNLINEDVNVHRKFNIEKYDLTLQNNDNNEIEFILYEYQNNKIINKYTNKFLLDYFISNSLYLKIICLISKNPKKINTVFNYLNKIISFNYNRNNNMTIFDEDKINIELLHDHSDQSKIFLYLDILLINLSKEKIKFELVLKTSLKNDDIKFNYLIKNLLEEENKFLKRINLLEKELLKKIDEKNNHKTLMKKCDAYYGQSILLKMDFMDMGIDSDIFKSKEDFFFLTSNVSKRINRQISNINQIFKASCNGDNIRAFYDCCLNVPNTLIIILTDEKKCFGGFTQAEWENNNKYKSDEKAFLFSINNKEIYPIKYKYHNMAINCCDDIYAPVFGSDIYIYDHFFSNNINKAQEGFYDYDDSKVKGDYKLNGKECFSVAELEIYQFIFQGDVYQNMNEEEMEYEEENENIESSF